LTTNTWLPRSGPLTLYQVTPAVGGANVEIVPGFDMIESEGKVMPCVAFCDPESKLRNRPINCDATSCGATALLRGGYPGLLKSSGRMADMLFGDVAVVFGDTELWRQGILIK
jgi:hypothetical protein